MDHQPGPGLRAKEKSRGRLIRLAASHPNWVLAFEDETWWSRLALPAMHTWAASAAPPRLVERAVPKGDTDPKAVSCYGLLRADTGRVLVRSVRGRPIGQVTEDFPAWACGRLREEGKAALLLVWDDAAWHVGKRVRARIRDHDRRAKRDGGVRIVPCYLPTKSPWLNPIGPKWGRGKKAVVEPDRLLSATEVVARVRDCYGCEELPHLEQISV